MAHFDAQAAREADIVFATTASLRDRHIRNNAQTRLVPNVADYDHFASGLFAQVPNALSALRRPIIGFAGNIVASKVDLAGLDRLSDTRPDWSWVLIGPVEKAMEARLAALASKPQIHYLGLVDYGSLPSYVAQFDVGLIPYHANSYTASVFPLKYYEYLAAGIPIVASGLVGLPHDRPDVHVLPTLDVAATAAIAEALKVSSPDDVERRQGYAFTHTWAHRAETVLAGASEVLAAKRT
jgi:glycosyltransferase involved in cell wall biosynthesis